jgi:hypothetical protein
MMNKDLHKTESALYKSHKILRELDGKEANDISKESASVLGLDVNCFTGIINVDPINKTTEFKLFEFSFTIDGDRIKIKKLNDGCI